MSEYNESSVHSEYDGGMNKNDDIIILRSWWSILHSTNADDWGRQETRTRPSLFSIDVIPQWPGNPPMIPAYQKGTVYLKFLQNIFCQQKLSSA